MIIPDDYWSDPTGRFEKRPFYRDVTLEAAALRLLSETLEANPTWPISDSDLEFLADMLSSFDRGRDMSELGMDVDAVTIFSIGRPAIIMSRALLEPNMRLRRRMTIAHEVGHVALHYVLYQRDEMQLNLLGHSTKVPALCEKAMASASVDWVEWQANFFAGALLAPKHELLRITEAVLRRQDVVTPESPEAAKLIAQVASELDISRDAARVRLAQVGIIRATDERPLFEAGNF